eukprot:672253-Pyramimonas_sp.AAC.2
MARASTIPTRARRSHCRFCAFRAWRTIPASPSRCDALFGLGLGLLWDVLGSAPTSSSSRIPGR